MNVNKFGEIVLNESDLCNLYMRDPELKDLLATVAEPIKFDQYLDIGATPELVLEHDQHDTIEQYDTKCQSNWKMPSEYLELDIAEWLLNQCDTDIERERVGQELILYLERGLFPLLQYLKYLVDTMRLNNIVWGVGRGSSVSSYVLYLLGVHKINSIHYNLDINEFLR